MNLLKYILLFLALAVFSQCATIHQVESLPYAPTQNQDYRYFDADSRIRYKVANDAKNLYITLNTNQPETIIKIMRTGLWVYFDVNGKKGKNTFVQYPVVATPTADVVQEDEIMFTDYENFRLKQEIENLNFEARYVHNKHEEFISALTGDIKMLLSSPNPNELTYFIQMPLTKIFTASTPNFSNLVVGIVTGGIEKKIARKTNFNSDPAMNQMGSAPGSMGLESMAQPANQLHQPIEIWFTPTPKK